jgi:two-component system OmpR family response regulator
MELSVLLVAMTPKAMHRHVLIVDENRDSRVALAAQLDSQGFRVTSTSGAAGMESALERTRIDLVLLDVTPGRGQLAGLCRALRGHGDLPFIVMAPRPDELERILGLEMGADDYLCKPVHPRELVARMRNILRRAHGAGSGAAAPRARLYRFGGWQLDVVARVLTDAAGRAAPLRTAEFRVLAALLSQGNRVVSRQRLFELARGGEAIPFDRSVDVRVSRLRRMLRDPARSPRIIKTVHGEGYVIGVDVERA